MKDPRFPNRPDHPDFWQLAAAVQDFDSAADDGLALDRLIGPIVDPESLMYIAEQRAMRVRERAQKLHGNPHDVGAVPGDLAKLQAAWIDAFAAGTLYQKRKDGP